MSDSQAPDNSEMAVLITDENSRVVYCNDAHAVKTGFAVHEIVGKKPSELWGGHMDRSFYESMWRTIKTDRKPFFAHIQNNSRHDSSWTDNLSIGPVIDTERDELFFIQLSPRTEYSSTRAAFEREFLQTFEQQQNAPELAISRLSSLLSLPQKNEAATLAAFIHAQLIAPTAARYRARTDDAELVLSAQLDPNAFALLYKKYYSEIRHYFSLRINSHHASADDLAQETFLSAFKSLSQYRQSNASYRTFLMRIAHNTLVDQYRKRHDILVDDWTVLERSTLDTCSRAAAPDESGILARLTDLPSPEQHALRLKYEKDFSTRQIAADMNKTENAVKLLISRGRKRLRGILGDPA